MFDFNILGEIKKELDLVNVTDKNLKIYEQVRVLVSLANDKLSSEFAVFLSDSEIRNLNSWFSSILKTIQNDNQNPQSAYYANLPNYIQSCWNCLKTIPSIQTEATESSLSQIISTFQTQTIKQKNEYEQKLNELEKKTESLAANVKQKEKETLGLTSTFQQQFSQAQENRLKEYNQIKQDFAALNNEHKISIQKIIEVYQKKTEEAQTLERQKSETFIKKIEDLYNIAGEKTIRGGYTTYANNAKNFAHVLFVASLLLMVIVGVLVILPLLATIPDFINASGFDTLGLWEQLKKFNWASLFYRIPVVAILLLPAFYLSKEVNRQREKEATYRELELKLGAIRPFFEHIGNSIAKDETIPQKEIVQFELAKNLLSKEKNGNSKNSSVEFSEETIKFLECLAKIIKNN